MSYTFRAPRGWRNGDELPIARWSAKPGQYGPQQLPMAALWLLYIVQNPFFSPQDFGPQGKDTWLSYSKELLLAHFRISRALFPFAKQWISLNAQSAPESNCSLSPGPWVRRHRRALGWQKQGQLYPGHCHVVYPRLTVPWNGFQQLMECVYLNCDK